MSGHSTCEMTYPLVHDNLLADAAVVEVNSPTPLACALTLGSRLAPLLTLAILPSVFS